MVRFEETVEDLAPQRSDVRFVEAGAAEEPRYRHSGFCEPSNAAGDPG
jgi:hypothetical protein